MKAVWKNERGLTLVKLLAIVVILGIISAIAVPSIGGIIDNSRKDAHVDNAQQMISSTELAVVGDPTLQDLSDGEKKYVPLGYLIAEGYIKEFDDPDGEGYEYEGEAISDSEGDAGDSYVFVEREGNGYNYAVRLVNGGDTARGVYDHADNNEDNDAVNDEHLDRDAVAEVEGSGGTKEN